MAWLAEVLYNHVGPHEPSWPCAPICSRVAPRMWDAYCRHIGTPLVRYWRLGLLVPMAHTLAHWQAVLPHYDRVLPELAREMRDHYPGLTVIDVGANVGDSAAALRRAAPRIPVLCIESDPRFLEILEENGAAWPEVCVVQALVGASDEAEAVAFTRRAWTTSPIPGGEEREVVSLSTLVERHPAFLSSKLLKIDTDGYEVRVLAGARRWLASARPVIFFEYDPRASSALGDDSLSIFTLLRDLGYETLDFYRNTGEFVVSVPARDLEAIRRLSLEMSPADRAWFADICAWPSEDAGIARAFRARRPSLA